MNNDDLSALGKDTNSTLYEQEKAKRIAKEIGYASVSEMQKMVSNIKKEMMEEEETNPLQTSALTEASETNANQFISNKLATGIENEETDIEKMFASFSEETENKIGKTIETSAQDIEDEIISSTADKIKTGVDKTQSKAEKIITPVMKTLKAKNKIVDKAKRFAKNNLYVFDADGNVDSVGSGANQVKTFSKFAGRNLIGKPVGKITHKVNTKITSKPINSAMKKIKKVEAKATEKLARTSIKGVNKLIQIVIKAISQIIQAVTTALISSLPFFLIFLLVIVIIAASLYIFGGSMNKEQLEIYANHINEVQTEFQNTTKSYYDNGYIVDGTYNGIAYIDWRAALSTMQSLQPELNGSKEEIEFFEKLEKDKILYDISEQQTSEYTLQEAVYDEEGNLIKEAVTTTKKYVVTIGILEDYKNWIKNNTDYLKEFYKSENATYDENATTFFTDELNENIDNLYNSEDFDMILEEAGLNLGSGSFGDDDILDTGQSNGILAYPTSYRKISAGYGTYPSGGKHNGVDFPVPIGTPICACADGQVIVVKNLNYSYGKYVVIKHQIEGQTLYTLYAHNSKLNVSVGQTVKKGQVIALSGSTGNSTGPHCHLSVLTSYNPQVYVNPMNYL